MIVSPVIARTQTAVKISSGIMWSICRRPAACSEGVPACGSSYRSTRCRPSGIIAANTQTAVATSNARSPNAPPNQLPNTGPRIQPVVNAIRTVATTRFSARVGCRLNSSRQAANSCAIEPPATLNASALITNGIQTSVATAIAIQPAAPITEQIRNHRSRSWVRSDHRPTR